MSIFTELENQSFGQDYHGKQSFEHQPPPFFGNNNLGGHRNNYSSIKSNRRNGAQGTKR